MQGLSEVEIRALAKAFNVHFKANLLLVRAGLTRDRVPEFTGTPFDYWSEISAQLEDGLLSDGRARILAAAAKSFPANEVFRVGSRLDASPGAVPGARERQRPPAGTPEHASLFFLDARLYSRRSMLGQVDWRVALREIVAAAVARLGLPAESIRLLQDQGDGFLGIVAGTEPKPYLASDFVRELQIAQRAYNDGREPGGRLRLRMSLHHGDVVVDGTGAAGDAVVVAARLIDAPQVRGVLERYPDADLVLALSPEYFRSTAAQRMRDLDPEAFREIDVAVGEKYAGTAWVTLPGHRANPPLDEDPAEPRPVDVPRPVDAPAGVVLSPPRAAASSAVDLRGDTAHAATPPDGVGRGWAAQRPGVDEWRRRIEDRRRSRKPSTSPPPFPGGRT